VRARYYDPSLGRFTSEDPIGLAGGINPYVYANSSPTNFRDPSGLCVSGKITYAQLKAVLGGEVDICTVILDAINVVAEGGPTPSRTCLLVLAVLREWPEREAVERVGAVGPLRETLSVCTK
jgi:hypothetical protein